MYIQNNWFKQLLLWTGCVAILSSCVNFNRFETAETLGVRNKSFEVNQGLSVLGDNRASTENVIPSLELTYRRGVTEKLDIGVTIPISTLVLVDGKYNFYESENGKFKMSTTPGVGYYLIKLDNGHPYLLSMPVIGSYRFSDKFAIGIIPKYVRFATQDNNKRVMNVLGAAAGVAIGENNKWNVSLGIYQTFETSFGSYYDQYMFGQFTVGRKVFYPRKKMLKGKDELKGG